MMEVRAKVTETDRDNLQAGQPATVQVMAPGPAFAAKVGPLTGSASRGNFFETSDPPVRHQPAARQAGSADARRLVAARRHRRARDPGALHIPRQAVFEKNARYVFLQVGPDRSDRRDIKVRTAPRAAPSSAG